MGRNARRRHRSVRRWFPRKAPARRIIVIIARLSPMDLDLDFEGYTCPVPIQPKGTVVLGHGSGGRLSHDLLNHLFLPDLGKSAPRVLDVACGSGMMLNGCAQRLTSGRAVGIDQWEQEVGGTRELTLANARAEGVADKVELREMDARHLEFEDAQFDVVVSSMALHHIGATREDLHQALSEMIRVLAPGGILSLADVPPMIGIAEKVLAHSGLEITRQEQTRFLGFVTARK